VIIIKVTLKAVLINETSKQKQIIENMMLVFCTALRYSFKRILEGVKILELEKIVAHKYNLNIRQAKDAVESARQTIVSQRELVKMNCDDYEAKIKAIEKILSSKKKLSERRKATLLKKLDKHKRRLKYFESFMDTNTITSVTFGTKAIFIRRCKGLITREEWNNCRNNRIYSRGDKTKKGNPNLRVIIKNNMTFLEISTLEKTPANKAVKMQVPLYLPYKLSKKTGKINGIDYRQLFLNYLNTGGAYQVELLKRNNRYYCHITFEVPDAEAIIYTGHRSIIGVDTNPDGFALTMIDNKGNYRWHNYLRNGELVYARSDRRTNLCGEMVKELVFIAKTYGTGLAIENLKFRNDKDVSSKFARVKGNFVYSKLLTMLESACRREGIELIKVHSAYTSKVGLYKYCHQYGLSVHNGAAMVIARRSYKFKERVPKIFKDKCVDAKYKDKFDYYNGWKKWSIISENIKRKVGENPGLWLANRKKILGLAS
jgi:IS605 OrfB family transposase